MPTIQLRPPLGGVVRSTAFQEMPPYTCSEAVNMVPFEPESRRKVLATRPFTGTFHDFSLPNSSLGVNSLVRVNGTSAQNPQRTILAAIEGTLYRWNGSTMTSISGTVTSDRLVDATPFLQSAVFCVDTTAPLEYDYTTDTLAAITASAGTVPVDNRVCATWQGALWLSSKPAEPHVISASRIGDLTDWDFTVPLDDTGAAWKGTGEDDGLVGTPVTALVPHTDDIMIVGGQDTLWAFRGHPRQGGTFENLSESVGIIGPNAWTHGPDGTLYFLALDGLYMLQPRSATPVPISPDIPAELNGIEFDMFDPVASLEYDSLFKGLHIFFRGSEARAWWYDFDTGSFWGMGYTQYPTVTARFDPIQTGRASGVIFGGPAFGGMSRWDLDQQTETSWAYGVKIGPIKISPNQMRQRIVQSVSLAAETPTDDNDISVEFFAGATGEDAYGRAQQDVTDRHFTVTSQTLRNNGWTCRPRVAGHALVVEISAAEDNASKFVLDGGLIETRDMGRARLNPTHRVPELSLGGGQVISESCYLNAYGTGTKFSSSGWAGYAENSVAIAQPVDLVADTAYLIDLAQMPAAWWANVKSDGSDIRATDAADTQLAMDLVSFNNGAQTGMVAVRVPSCYGFFRIRLWCGNSGASSPAAGSTYGQYNAYDAEVLFFPMADANDRTSTQSVLAGSDAPTFGGASGPSSFTSATRISYDNISGSSLEIAEDTFTAVPVTDISVLAWHKNVSRTFQGAGALSDPEFPGLIVAGPAILATTFFTFSSPGTLSTDEIRGNLDLGDLTTAAVEAGSEVSEDVTSSRGNGFNHMALTFDDGGNIVLYLNALSVDTEAESVSALSDLASIQIGNVLAAIPPNVNYNTNTLVDDYSLVSVFNVSQPASFVNLRRRMIEDHNNLYGNWNFRVKDVSLYTAP